MKKNHSQSSMSVRIKMYSTDTYPRSQLLPLFPLELVVHIWVYYVRYASSWEEFLPAGGGVCAPGGAENPTTRHREQSYFQILWCLVSFISVLPACGAGCVGTEAEKDVKGFVWVSDRSQEKYWRLISIRTCGLPWGMGTTKANTAIQS
jgi:hypothetical protein